MLTRDQISQYQERGFLAVEDVLPRDLIEQAGAVVEAEDVVGEQVTVAVDHPAGCHPAIEQCLASRKELVGELFDLGCHLGLEHGTMERADLIETVSPPGADRVAGAVGGDFYYVFGGVGVGFFEPGDYGFV